MAIVEPRENLGIFLLPQFGGAGGKTGVIAIVGADDLDLIDAHVAVALSESASRGCSHSDYCGSAKQCRSLWFPARIGREHDESSLVFVWGSIGQRLFSSGSKVFLSARRGRCGFGAVQHVVQRLHRLQLRIFLGR